MFWINVSWNKPFWSTFAPSYPYGKYYISDHLYSRLCSLKCCLLVLAVPKDCLEGALNRTLQSLSVLYHVSSANGKDLVPLGAHDTLSCTFFRNQWTTFYIFHFAHLCWDVGYFANQLYFEIKQNNIHLTLPLVCFAPWIAVQPNSVAPFPSIAQNGRQGASNSRKMAWILWWFWDAGNAEI